MRKTTKRLPLSLIAAVLAVSTIGTPAAWASSPHGGTPRSASVQTFVPPAPPASELGTTVAEVAARHQLPSTELERRLKKDRHLRIGRGRLMFAEPALAEMPAAAEGAVGATALGSVTAAAPTASQAFTLHSLPGAKRVIFLDFDGHNLTGTAWGSKVTVAPPFDTDGSPSTFSDAERNVVIGTWQRVAEDYAAFDVDVTTQYPGESSITRASSADEYYGMRVLVSPISSYFGGGGIAYIGVFGAVGDYYKPALVFPEALANMDKYIGEACSHEAGHTLGLYHDGTTTGSAYYAGHGTGETAWAPIMGVGYYRNLSQWSKGEYPNANNKEDDLTIIQGNGLAVRPDDYGNANASAYVIPSGSSFSRSGVIERNTDVDVFSMTVAAGALTANLIPATLGPDMDLLAELRNSSGTLVASANPADLLGGSMSVNVSAGTYYLTVKGTGKGDLTTGYSSYATVGSYTISGTMQPGTVVRVPPTASAKATPSSGVAPLVTQFDSSLSADSDGSIVSWYWNFGDGTTSTLANPSHTYATAGTYSASLTVTDNSGLTATANVSIAVTAANSSPTASISASPLSGVAPVTTTFSATGSSDRDGSIVAYAWDFGDGTQGTGISTSHAYTTAGTFTARLTVTDNAGASGTSNVVVTVSAGNSAPTASISASPVSGTAPLTTTFSGAGSSDRDGSIAAYSWDFGDGTQGTGVSTSHAYAAAGTYTARLTVTDNAGASGSSTVAITVAAPNGGRPVVVAAATVTGIYAPLTAKLSAEGSYDPDGTIRSYKWDFGDGSTASGKTLSHTYKNAGIYVATVTAMDNVGNTSSTSVTIVATQDPSKAVHVASIQMTLTTYSTNYAVSVRVNVVGPDGKPVGGVMVVANWSGAITKAVKTTSNSTGNANFDSGRFTGGPIYFGVSDLAKASYAYDASSNTVTIASLAPAPR